MADFFLAVVYPSPNRILGRRLWEDLCSAKLGLEGPWLVLGDFNSVISSEEVSCPETFSQQCCHEFVDWIFGEELVDLGWDGPRFMWERRLSDQMYKAARLDRGLS